MSDEYWQEPTLNSSDWIYHGSDRYLKCYGYLDWTDTLQMEMYQDWAKERQPTLLIKPIFIWNLTLLV